MKLAPTIHTQAQTLRLGRWTNVLLLAITAAGLPGCGEKDPTGTDLTTSSEGAQAGAEAGVVAAEATAAAAQAAATASGTIPLPINQTITSDGLAAFSITQKGLGGLGLFKVDNTAASSIALRGETNGSGYAVQGVATGKGIGGYFQTSSSSASDAVRGHTFGSGNAVHGVAVSDGQAGLFENTYHGTFKPALRVRTQGSGPAAAFESTKSNNGYPVVAVTNRGAGYAGAFVATTTNGRGVLIETKGGAGLQVIGGSKNAVVRTPSGAKALYTEESTEVWFTDYGFGRLANDRARVLLDPSFAQTINPDESYHVFLQARGRAELYVGETTPLGFEVLLKDGDPNAEFSYRIVAKRLGFEGKRLEGAPWADRPSAVN
jgi:hypothetical protein